MAVNKKEKQKTKRYVALLRGINVGGNHRVPMKELKSCFESFGAANVITYINSGNVIFDWPANSPSVAEKLEKALKKHFNFPIPVIVKTESEMRRIAKAIPPDWRNDTKERTDVAYLFDSADSKKSIASLPFNFDFIEVRYVKGALIFHIADRVSHYQKSRLNKLIMHELYQQMTMRNVNTARYLAGLK